MQHPKKWWIGAPILVGIVYFAAQSLTADIESSLTESASARLADAGQGVIENPGVSVAGRDVIVTGRKLSEEGLADTLRSLRDIPGVRLARDGSTLPEAISPYAVTFTRADGRVTIEGNLPSSRERETLQAELRKGGVEVSDHSSLGLGAPLGFMDLARFAARVATQLDEGQISITDNAIAIKGVAAASADVEALASAKAAPQGAKLASVQIEPYRIKPFVWSAERVGRRIVLAGFAPDAAARDQIVANARAVAAGDEVEDRLRIARGAPTGDFVSAAETALAQLRSLAAGKAALSDNGLRVSGEGKANVSSAGLAAEIRRNLPNGFELAAIDVADGPASPYLFSATAHDGVLLLSGHVPDADAQKQISALAGADFAKFAATDALSEAKGAPAEFMRAAIAGLKALAQLSSGGLAISDTTLGLTGIGAPSKVSGVEEALKRDLPGNFVATIQITSPADAAPAQSAPAPDIPTASIAATSPASRIADAPSLQQALNALLEASPIPFRADTSELAPESAAPLAALAALLRRSGDSTVEIRGHSPEPNIAELQRTIAKRRAQAVAQRLLELGVEESRLSASGAASPSEDHGALIDIKVRSF